MCREKVTETPPWLPVLSELAMPFYLTHQQLLVPLAAAASWVPYLSQFYRVGNLVIYLTIQEHFPSCFSWRPWPLQLCPG